MSALTTVIYLLHSADVSPESATAKKAITWLSDTERDRMKRFTKSRAQFKYLLGRALVRGQLAKHCNILPPQLQFAIADGGKPYLQDTPQNLYFNLSHSGQWLALAVSSLGPVGVDIEHPQKPRNFINIARHYFHRSEYRALNALQGKAQQEAFYRLWTLKEAFFKARGTGIVEGLARIRFTNSNAPIAATIEPELLSAMDAWQFYYWPDGPELNGHCHLAFASPVAQPHTPIIKRIDQID